MPGLATSPSAVVASLAARIDAALGPLVDAGRPIALVGFPNHPNVGDAAIWAGEAAWLRRRGREVAYACDLHGYRRDRLARRLGRGTILLHGGGNLGDLWPYHQEFRERVVADFLHNPIVSLPQTMRFRDPGALRRAQGVFGRHDALALLLRDERSLEDARSAFGATSELCPDMAFALGPLSRPEPERDAPLLWLARTDEERTGPRLLPPGPGWRIVDWLDDSAVRMRPRERRLRRFATRAGQAVARRPPASRHLARPQARLLDLVARDRMNYGLRLLGPAHGVVTDRLHAHVLSVLLGIPNVLVDTGYGKLRTFYELWTAECETAAIADDAAGAAAQLPQLLRT
jgi:exopolysaccharide biosynthesis predicted pyruvyltransferase EpsI